jgi:hypothetical protein
MTVTGVGENRVDHQWCKADLVNRKEPDKNRQDEIKQPFFSMQSYGSEMYFRGGKMR